MDRFWDSVVHPLLLAAEPKNVLHTDIHILDGDPNWYTVYEALRTIERNATGKPFPIIVIHNTDWPYGERDLYQNPSAIPAQYRHSAARGGVVPGQQELSASGINANAIHATHAGGPQNGVRAAIAEFLAHTQEPLTRVDVPGLYGITLLLPHARCTEPSIQQFLASLHYGGGIALHLDALEQEREERWLQSSMAEHQRLAANELLRQNTVKLTGLAQYETYIHKLERTQEQLASAQNAIAHLTSTRSWRWTKPLRKAEAWFRTLFSPLQQQRSSFVARTETAHWHLGTDEPLLSIIIPSHGKWEYTQRCIDAVERHTAHLPREIILIDDASEEAPPHAFMETPFVFLRNATQQGYVDSCNRGAQQARGRFLVFLNNDTEVTPGWADALLETFRQRPEAGLVGSKLLYPDGRLQEAGGMVFADGSALNYGKGDDPYLPKYNVLREVDYCSGACLMIEAAFFWKLGGYDVRYAPGYYEDTALAFAVREAGKEVFYQPHSIVVHHEGITAGRQESSGMKQYQERNRLLFRAQWASALAQQPAPHAAVDELRTNKPRVLVVDHALPFPDKDSGSLRMTEILRLLCTMGWQVTFAAEHLAAQTPYKEQLELLGVEVLARPHIRSLRTHLRERGERYQMVILCRVSVAGRLMDAVRANAPQARVIFDTVDLHFLRARRHAALLQDEELYAQSDRLKRQELALVCRADLTWVVSNDERDLLLHACPGSSVECISNVHTVQPTRTSFSQRKDVVFIGNFHHLPNVDAVEYLLEEVLPHLQKMAPDIGVSLVGDALPLHLRERALHAGCAVLGHVPHLDDVFGSHRLSIAPLRFGAGVKGKITMSMGYGVPVVATSLAAEGMHLTHGKTALIADDAKTFAAHIVELYRDETLWHTLSENGRAHLTTHFSRETARRALERSLAVLRSIGHPATPIPGHTTPAIPAGYGSPKQPISR